MAPRVWSFVHGGWHLGPTPLHDGSQVTKNQIKPGAFFQKTLIGGLLGAMLLVVAIAVPAGAASPPKLHLTSGNFHNGQLINLSVGPNHFFTHYTHVNILECADPGGKKKNLPTNVDSCDGNTIQGNTVVVQKNGSFSEHNYQVFSLPNAKSLGEDADSVPACSAKKKCVLYVGQNQESFAAPKLFSRPFTVSTPVAHKR
jgi:hypothetical protein